MNILANKKILIVIIGSVIICILVITLLLSISQKTPTSTNTSPTPTSVPVNTSIGNDTSVEITAVPTTVLKDSSHNFTLRYPDTFTQVINSNPDDTSLTLTFNQYNKTYHFLVSPPGQINPEVDATTQIQQSYTVYGEKTYTKKTWLKKGIPFYVVAIPKDLTTTPYLFSMELPPTNTDQYIQTFEKIVSSFSQ